MKAYPVIIKKYIDEFKTLITYAKGLAFEEEPNYKYIKKLLKSIFIRENFTYDFRFDWNLNAPALSTRTHISIKMTPRKESNSHSELKSKEQEPK